MGPWKGIRLGREEAIQLYNLEQDLGETNDIAAEHPEIVKKIAAIMQEAVKPHPRYPVGTKYRGRPIWKKGRVEKP